jgi:hypothetical protein
VKRKSVVALAIGALFLSQFPFAESATADVIQPLYILQDCSITPDKECIESIDVTDGQGVVRKATLTGRTWKGDENYGPNGTYKDATYDEYQVDGLQFESPAGNRIIPRIFHFPLGNNPCEYAGTVCAPTQEFIQVVIEASWFSGGSAPLKLPHRITDNYCGTSTNPVACGRNLNFNQDLKFNVVIHMPKEFQISYVTGRSKDLTFSQGTPYITSSGISLNRLNLSLTSMMVQRMLFTPLLSNPFQTSDYADFESDQVLANIYSTRSSQGVELGRCAGIPSISVTSNSANVSLPKWDPLSQSISLSLENSHYKVDGSINTGFFQAAISSEIGKCLWGIDLSSQTKAEISITENNGANVQSVEVLTGRFANGIYYLSHSNFHYSSPNISFKLSAGATPKPSSSPLATPTATPSLPSLSSPIPSKKLIKCQKLNTVKVITSLNPRCPSGYKKIS